MCLFALSSAVRVKEQVVGWSDGGVAQNEANAAISLSYITVFVVGHRTCEPNQVKQTVCVSLSLPLSAIQPRPR